MKYACVMALSPDIESMFSGASIHRAQKPYLVEVLASIYA